MCSYDSEFEWPATIQSSTMDLQLWRIADPILQSIYMFLTVAHFNRWCQVSTTTKGEYFGHWPSNLVPAFGSHSFPAECRFLRKKQTNTLVWISS
jgi:hypothetical protein